MSAPKVDRLTRSEHHKKSLVTPALAAAAIASLLVLAACQQAPASIPAPPASTEDTDAPVSAAQDPTAAPLLDRIGGLDRQALDEGECGLFLWSAIPKRRLVLFQRAASDTADMRLDGTLIKLSRTRAEGDTIFGIFPQQSLKYGSFEAIMAIDSEQAQPVTKGAVIRQASLRVTDASGWSLVMPVAGLVSCQ